MTPAVSPDLRYPDSYGRLPDQVGRVVTTSRCSLRPGLGPGTADLGRTRFRILPRGPPAHDGVIVSAGKPGLFELVTWPGRPFERRPG